jgi:hypothetical protein
MRTNSAAWAATGWAVAMAVTAARLDAPHGALGWVWLFLLTAAALVAGRPPRRAGDRAGWWRTSGWCLLFVALIAASHPTTWQAVTAATVLGGYLVALDAAEGVPLTWWHVAQLVPAAGVAALAVPPAGTASACWPTAGAALAALGLAVLLAVPLRVGAGRSGDAPRAPR